MDGFQCAQIRNMTHLERVSFLSFVHSFSVSVLRSIAREQYVAKRERDRMQRKNGTAAMSCLFEIKLL